MKIKKTAALILAASLTLGSAITSLGGIQVVQGTEISTKVGDDRTNTFGTTDIKFVFKEFDPASGLIPVRQIPPTWREWGEEERDDSRLLFLNTSGEIAIPVNENWRLVSGFQSGQAFVREASTNALVRIDTAGQETGRFSVEENIARLMVLPDSSPYAFFCITGKAGGPVSESENFKALFVEENGSVKTVELQGTYWDMGQFESNGYAPLFKVTGTYDTQWRIEGAEDWETVTHYNTAQIDYLDVNGVIHSGSMPGYVEKEAPEYIPAPYDIGLPFDNTTKKYIYRAASYELRKVDFVSGMGDIYEIFDKSGAGTGVKIYSIAFGTDSFVIARAFDPAYEENFSLDRLKPPYYIYYINQTN